MTNPHRHLSRRDAERLLDDPASVDSALGSALAAASAPARPGELRREEMAVAAFHRARLEPVTAAPARRAGRAATRAVVATGALVALASGGFALASSVDLPLLPDRASDRATEAVAPSSSTTSTTSTTGSSATTGTPGSADGTDDSETPGGSASPSPDLEGLCRAFQASDRSGQGRSLASAAFRALATAAGGTDRVATFCVDLIGAPKPRPTPGAKPTDKPSGKPTTLPTPTAKPTPTSKPSATSTPTSKPTSKPTSTPTPQPTPTAKPTPTDQPTGRPSDAGNGGSGSDTGKGAR